MISLVIFTCEGREHLINTTIDSFRKVCDYSFNKIILAIDGNISQRIIDSINPDIVIQNRVRKGYVQNISNALSNVETEYFFWLEDDWNFNRKIDLPEMTQRIQSSSEAIQFVLGKNELTEDDLEKVEGDLYTHKLGFSANPCICKTSPLVEAFSKIKKLEKNEQTKFTGFENFITEYMKMHGFVNFVLYSRENYYISHSGYLESTAREFHMVNSIDSEKSDIGKNYISGFNAVDHISIQSKVAIVPKLLLQVLKVLLHSPFKRKYYDMALRTYIALSNFNKRT